MAFQHNNEIHSPMQDRRQACTNLGGRYDTKEAVIFWIQDVVCSKCLSNILLKMNECYQITKNIKHNTKDLY